MVSSEDPNIKVAEKRIVLENRSIHFVNKEFSIHKQLSEISHDNVIKMFEMRQCPSFYYFVLEYAENGDVFDRIIPGSGMKFSVAQKYFKQLIAGLKFINANHLIHRDIKPENLLITKNDVIKICDFGSATIFRRNGKELMLKSFGGTEEFIAPEVWGGVLHRGPPLDVWSAGITLINMMTGLMPWKRADEGSIDYRRWIRRESLSEKPWNKVDKLTQDFLQRILTSDVENRLTIAEIESHCWMNQRII
ncbi:hypothetical protein GCK72_008116 [Caenorhabditis remanei]|uniref:Protein kinase domain-containing protein n=1 Tax=Caenorhabditis remanei TaxID=31234 RepID=A0A6A5HNH8_CAERE|nr:hypothetical protein GCK72_008116 [Caenorhabditis remanei]KAF1768154.1 hypothetical protein GCK72_008116 [Caenorhabditis remanei]